MNDPRLNSIHLELPRREEFRAARELLLNGCGERTLCGAAANGFAEGSAASLASVDKTKGSVAVDAKFVLLDRELIYPLKIGLNTVGRMPDNDVVVEDGYVSRRHCAILVHADDRCELQDVASKNGTLLNGRKIAGPTILKTGDEIRMCNKNLIFSERADPAGPSTHATQVE
ncbi:MAG TPA: FHA domain-containing protein [Gemmataceae bacterium]|nr:FHA domain-containing protein [Gemmataceae bacterium]